MNIEKNLILNRYLFIVIICKLILLITFSSELSDQLFIPFINTFIEKGGNPWQYYFDNGLHLDSFPYHALLLYILSSFTFLSNITGLDLFFKLPLLIADVSILLILYKIFPNKKQNIFIYYFLNPIIIYSIYIHGQLDIIPTALFMLAVYYLIKNKYLFSSVFLACALATKFHLIVALPFIIFYLYKTNNIKKIFSYLLLAIGIFFIRFAFLFSKGFIELVLFNQKQSLLFDSFYNIGELKLLLPISAILTVYFHFFNQNKVNDDLLFFILVFCL